MTFNSGQRVLASTLNSNMPQAIATTILGASQASISITIPSGFNQLQCTWTARSDTATTATSAVLQFNGDSGNNYLWQQNEANNATVTGSASGALTGSIRVGAMPAASGTASYFGTGSFSVGNISGSTFKVVAGSASAYVTTTNSYIGLYGGQWVNTAVITSINLLAAAGNLIAGSTLTVYGLK